ncbi:hypothetical protein LOZ53_002194 [Ophidiomyces ophidiicola]|uniref:Uncharacterized protein n=1 Tax=Ophidiomyces ophidiicola TaxID=1387563 RepID=A0ACB8UYD1_9EURO|nr:uncharacterized protein LOZ57_003714 [Ophidiomyces ophidiicola]KAI1917141.1 hypothetical protein LOZ61_000658 [Ophidiomyces ophidiicola]KAI1922690.1 hypothetical protein LOZ64_001248 [Ophidiomyces ophidiicola]KAI1929739.1 hypothetical protein LOZ60_001486 [Ophidiomyces ophidiicola]KAI1946238.1 hypothetical protein LOZ62_003458 [Ophidiomyces ophidiicola]KAI1946459.1 hypothetical protein LOZ57_003714 [Ophidiomyces ophidiicola]
MPDPSPASGSNSQPLLFFVALGFGVVFTNLWIIVGVKYCFRYNQRHRQLRNEDTGEPIDLMTVPRTRRRREKKLMTMDEVNSRFPLVKYKAWRASRADDGLPTAGGIEPPTTAKPASLKRASGSYTDNTSAQAIPSSAEPSGTNDSEQAPLPKSDQAEKGAVQVTPDAQPSTANSKETPAPQNPNASRVASDDDDDHDDHDDPIHAAVPTDLLANPGDSCAICLDTIEDDDDVRGLTCGHAFHASCLDPWLTSRRACCPLCKADYYVPKPRPDGADNSNEPERGRRNPDQHPAPPEPAAFVSRLHPFTSRIGIPGRFLSSSSATRQTSGQSGEPQRPSNNAADPPANNGTGNVWRPRLPPLAGHRIFLPSFDRSERSQERNTPPTPRQLESGAR